VERILRYKKQYINIKNNLKNISSDVLVSWQEKIKYITQSTLASREAGKSPPPLGETPFFAGSLAYRSTIASSAPDKSQSSSRWFAEQFNGDFLETPINPDITYIDSITSSIPITATSIIFCSYNGHLNKGQMELAKALCEIANKRNLPFINIALRNPWDLHLMPQEAYTLALWEYTAKSFEAAAAAFRGEFIPTGKLP
jgi:hypothetical protein